MFNKNFALGSANEWVRPIEAVEFIKSALDLSSEDAINVIVRRLITKRIISMYEEYVGPRSELHNLYPEFRGMPIWCGLWLNQLFRTPSSPIWRTGDFEGSLGEDSLFLLNIRFRAVDIHQTVLDCGGSQAAVSDNLTTLSVERLSKINDPDPDAEPIAWTEAEMKVAIAQCSERNRDKAWKTEFAPQRRTHGWDVNAFRQIWSEARGTKGMIGRPIKR